MRQALGIHVFAGGFTLGVQKVHEVKTHLETHGFALDTAQKVTGAQCINCEAKDWPHVKADWVFGNPRCTGFSCITSGYGEETHGAWAKQTRDIHELMEYSVKHDYPVICWESVQQAYSTGRELLDYIRDHWCVPNGYRIAHLFINAGTFGNSQMRKRYFFLAYKGDMNFNIEPPELYPWRPSVYDACWHLRDEDAYEFPFHSSADYDGGAYTTLTDDEKEVLPRLPNGYDINKLGRFAPTLLPEHYQFVYKSRTSDMPFSLHCLHRTSWLTQFPTMSSSCIRQVHPHHHRPFTVRELASAMGWGDKIPVGKNPGAQLAKGVVPAVGEWLARQVDLYLDDVWGDQDWESSYDPKLNEWVGEHCPGKVEKVYNLTNYVSQIWRSPNVLPYGGQAQRYRFNLDPDTGRPIIPWDKLVESRRGFA